MKNCSNRIKSFSLSLCASGVMWSASHAGDWPNWLGPDKNNIAVDAEDFSPELEGWKVAWSAEVGLGYSSVTVADGRAVTMGHDGEGSETIYCLDIETGDLNWKRPYPAELLPAMHPGGPNASPTIAGNLVVAVSKDGQVHALDVESGEVVWEKNLLEVLGIETPRWGIASSAVVHGDQVLLSAGRVAALDLKSGKVTWVSSNTYAPGYTTPIVFNESGSDYIAALDGKGICILRAADGFEIARHPFKAQYDMVASTPIVFDGGRLFISGNMTGEMLAFDGKGLESLWTTRDLRCAMNNGVVKEGKIYGIDGRQGASSARFVCVDTEDGSLVWERERYGYGTAIGIGDEYLLSLTENGELVAIEPKAEGFQEISRRSILDKTCWTTPVYAAKRIFVRNDKGRVICLSGS